ncbi:MAG: hypothetical protein ACRDPY_07165 [Streptosporangiaceae bacterium]
MAAACAGAIWACYAFFIGRLGGKAFEDRPWAGFLLAFGAALAASAVVEIARRARPWRVLRRVSTRQERRGDRQCQGGAAQPDPGRRPPAGVPSAVPGRGFAAQQQGGPGGGCARTRSGTH